MLRQGEDSIPKGYFGQHCRMTEHLFADRQNAGDGANVWGIKRYCRMGSWLDNRQVAWQWAGRFLGRKHHDPCQVMSSGEVPVLIIRLAASRFGILTGPHDNNAGRLRRSQLAPGRLRPGIGPKTSLLTRRFSEARKDSNNVSDCFFAYSRLASTRPAGSRNRQAQRLALP